MSRDLWRFQHLSSPKIRTMYMGQGILDIFISVAGGGRNQLNLSELSPVSEGLTPPETELFEFCALWCDYALPICRIAPVTHTKASHLRPAAPTAYGAAEMASPSFGSDSRRRHSSSSSNGSSDGESTSPAILLPYLPKPRSLAAAVGFAFLWRRKQEDQSTLHKPSFKNHKSQQMLLIFHPCISGSSF